MIVELAVDDLLRRLHDGFCPAGIERSERQLGFRRGALDDGERPDDRARHALLADTEIIARTLGLRAPVAVRRHFDRAERIGFGAGLHFFRKRSSRTTSAPPPPFVSGSGAGRDSDLCSDLGCAGRRGSSSLAAAPASYAAARL